MQPNNTKSFLYHLTLILYILLIMIKFTLSVDVRCIEGERLTLLKLRQGFVDSYDSLSTWGDVEFHHKECCNWSGVHCSDNTNHVVMLSLSHYYLGGNISEEVEALSQLKHLDLSANSLTGIIPPQLENLSQLQYLDLAANHITGLIPHQLGNLSQLQYLDLSWNYITGSIPHQLGNLSCLQELYLDGNQLGGIIPDTFGSLSSLRELGLGRNHFNGRLPNALWNLCHLREFDLRSNYFNERLDDFLHSTMGKMPRCLHQSLQYLNLRSNQLTGSIPDLSSFVELQLLFLEDNKLNGTVSDGIGQLSNLQILDISSNPLQGIITEDHFSKLFKLTALDMFNTSLSFNISKSWIPPFQLEVLDLSYCKIGPYFPKWLKTQRSIEILTLHHTEIEDVLPDWIWGGTGNPIHLHLSHNKIQGEITNLPIQFSSDSTIDLSGNQLRGEIPPFLFQALELNLSTNMFSGSLFPMFSITHNSSLEFLDISHNQFSEVLPAECWLHFVKLVHLDLSFNNFFGEIPASLLSLPSLHFLHLRNNKFRSIPSLSSTSQTRLKVLDLSENEISDFLPSWIGDKLVNLNVLSLRNNKFYGSLPSNICNLTQIVVVDLSENNLSGSIPKCFNRYIVLSNSSNLDGFLYYFGRRTYTFDSITLTWKGRLQEYGSILNLQRTIDLSDNQLTGEIPVEIMDLVQLRSLNLSFNKLGGEIDPKIGRLKNLETLVLSMNRLEGPIPSTIAQLNSLDNLNLSFNNLSGKIPTGFQLQTLNDASIYTGNLELCGPPLNRICLVDKKGNGKSNSIDGDDENDNLFETYGFYISLALRFIVGFWTSCISLVFNKSWKVTFFNLCTRISDNVHVRVKISVNKLRRRGLEA